MGDPVQNFYISSCHFVVVSISHQQIIQQCKINIFIRFESFINIVYIKIDNDILLHTLSLHLCISCCQSSSLYLTFFFFDLTYKSMKL